MHESPAHPTSPTPTDKTEIDPVCGMKVHPATARGGSHDHAGTRYYFCNPKCRDRFRLNPEKYLPPSPPLSHSHSHPHPPASPSPSSSSSPTSAPIYTGPMHP